MAFGDVVREGRDLARQPQGVGFLVEPQRFGGRVCVQQRRRHVDDERDESRRHLVGATAEGEAAFVLAEGQERAPGMHQGEAARVLRARRRLGQLEPPPGVGFGCPAVALQHLVGGQEGEGGLERGLLGLELDRALEPVAALGASARIGGVPARPRLVEQCAGAERFRGHPGRAVGEVAAPSPAHRPDELVDDPVLALEDRLPRHLEPMAPDALAVGVDQLDRDAAGVAENP